MERLGRFNGRFKKTDLKKWKAAAKKKKITLTKYIEEKVNKE